MSYSQSHFELVQLMSSGIYEFWKYWVRDRKYYEAKVIEENSSASPEPLSLMSNVFFVFIILITS